MEKEIRMINTAAKVEMRDDGTPGSVYGYAIVYNKDSEDMGFVERIAPGAAKKALDRSDIRGLKNHDPSLIFGRQGVNLTLKDDNHGLRYEATPIDTATYRQVAEEVRVGLLTGQSFGFTIKNDEWHDLESDHPKRTITEIGEIFDVGPVTYPAYQDTSVGLRSLEKAREEANHRTNEKTIAITVDGKTYKYSGGDRFDRAAEKIESLRSAPSPTTADADNTDDEPTLKTSTDDTMERIDQTLKRYERDEK